MARERTPIIAVTGPHRGGRAAWLFTRRAIRRAGGAAVRVRNKEELDSCVFDGLVLGGGADIEPLRCGARLLSAPKRSLIGAVRWRLSAVGGTGIDKQRDALEFRALERALAKQAPVLGICRGCQLINIFCGGTLHQELTGFYEETPAVRSIFAKKRVQVVESSLLARIVSASQTVVNALHRQAIDRLGEALRINAREANGIIQGIEMVDQPFVLGVQWHPEYMPQHPTQRQLFSALLAATRGDKTRTSSARQKSK